MAIPLDVLPAVIRVPRATPVVVRARITSPLAVESDSYLGGFASGRRLRYSDARQFVWWTPDALPTDDGAGFATGFSEGFR